MVTNALPFVTHYICGNTVSGTMSSFHQIETPPLQKKTSNTPLLFRILHQTKKQNKVIKKRFEY